MAYHNESLGRKKARALITRTGHHLGKAGGHLGRDDRAADIAMITNAIHAHERHDHKGEKLTHLKLADGGVADGPMASRSASKTPRGKGKGAAKNHIAIVISPQAGQGAGAAPPRPVPVPVPGPGAGAPPPMPPRPMPPPGGMPPMGGAPMGAGPGMPPPGLPMRKHGGRAHRDPKIAREAREEGESYEHELREHEHRARGGRAAKHGHAESLASHMPGAADDYGEHEPMKLQRPEQELETAEGQHRGGRTHHARGGEVGPGRVPNMRAGAGSGEGRLEKSGDLAYCAGGRS